MLLISTQNPRTRSAVARGERSVEGKSMMLSSAYPQYVICGEQRNASSPKARLVLILPLLLNPSKHLLHK